MKEIQLNNTSLTKMTISNLKYHYLTIFLGKRGQEEFPRLYKSSNHPKKAGVTVWPEKQSISGEKNFI